MLKVSKKKYSRNRGQAIFEFLVFLPFMLLLYFSLMSLGNSINGSINQQKIVRGYYFARIKGNPMIPRKEHTLPNWSQVGMFMIGWAEDYSGGGGGGSPIAPCYKLQSLVSSSSEGTESCKSSYRRPTTNFIRVYTAFGLCGATYVSQDDAWIMDPMRGATMAGCSIR